MTAIWGLMTMMAAAPQALPPVPPPPPVVVAPPPAPAAVDPGRLAKAQQLLELVHIERQYEFIFAQMSPGMTLEVFTSLRNNIKVPQAIRSRLDDPAQLAEAERIFNEESRSGFRARYSAMRAATAREYALAFTAEELDELVRFYRSPVGQKALSVLPTLQAKLMPIGMATGMQVGRDAIRKTFDRMKFGVPAPTT